MLSTDRSIIQSAKDTFSERLIAMFYRQDLATTVTDLRDTLASRAEGGEYVRVAPDEIEFHLDATDPTITVKDFEVRADETSLDVLGSFLSVPSAFMKRMVANTSGTTQNLLLGEILRNSVRKDMAVNVNQSHTGLIEIDEWGGHVGIKPYQVLDAILPAFSGHTPMVARLIDEPHQFAFDAYSPFDAENFGIGGDFAEGDLTAAGVRIDVNLKQGLAPSVQPYTYRRFCTNGMETPMAGVKIDARGQSVEEVLAELESMAQLAFAQAEKDVEHFYELRNQPVDNPERAITAIARERGIPNRSTMAILQLAAGEDLPDDPSMFDVVNLITNYANAPAVNRDGGRLILERAGGAVVSDHASRCGHCQQKVV